MLLEDARLSASELERLVDDYLTAARLTAGALTLKIGVVDLDELVARIFAGIEQPARLSVRVGELGACTGDAMRIRQIIRNLVRNANRFVVSEIEVRAVRSRDLATVEIVNDGEPVPAGVIDKLFDPFVKAVPANPIRLGWVCSSHGTWQSGWVEACRTPTPPARSRLACLCQPPT